MKSFTKVAIALIYLSPFGSLSADDIQLQLPTDFHGEKIYEVPNRQGSWVSMTVDPKGRLIVSDQYGSLYRVAVNEVPPAVEPVPVKIGYAQGLLCAFDSLYVVAHQSEFDSIDAKGNKKNVQRPSGLYRVRDTNSDDVYDTVELLREFQGNGEHGPHAVILGPEKKSLYICAGNHTALPHPEKTRVPRVWKEDQLTPRLPDAGGHGVGIKAPGGWICKTDPNGSEFELIAIGFRNQYDIAFNREGDLFTYDADMEWDIGLPWYRPTRVCHVVSGADFGWRNGSGKWPTYFPDSVPPVIDIGPGSPTGIVFGTEAKFPPEFQKSLFIADWSYGIIYQVDLDRKGESYTATKSTFCSGPVLPVTDLVINPHDGAMYFLTGGRKSRSALYRVSYQGDRQTSPLPPLLNEEAGTVKSMARYHSQLPQDQIDFVWEKLGSVDRHIRFAARTAIELNWKDAWFDRPLTELNEWARLEALLAMIRMATNESKQRPIFDALSKFEFEKLSEKQKLHLLRIVGLAMMRLGEPKEESLRWVRSFSSYFPNPSDLVNRELSRVLAAAESKDVVRKSVKLMLSCDSQYQQIHYAMVLHAVKSGWTDELIEQYLQWFIDASRYSGGSSFRNYLINIHRQFVGELPESKLARFASLIETPLDQFDPLTETRKFIRNWKLEDLDDLDLTQADTVNGKRMYAVAQCNRCHIIENDGGVVGPNLSTVGRRFNTHDLLETIVNPNKEISDQYQATTFLLDDGRVITGRISNLVRNLYYVQEDMIRPGELTLIKAESIEDLKPSNQSMMPSGLLDTLTKKEIADLVSYLKSTVDD